MFRKGQAAMEYLMTYGWALLVIVIVIAVLILINPFGASSQCIFGEAGFACNQPADPVVSTDGTLNGYFTNGQKKPIKIFGVQCYGSGTPGDLTADVDYRLAPGDRVTFETIAVDGGAGTQFSCVSDGTGITGSTTTTAAGRYTAGSQFQGNLVVYYRYDQDVIGGTSYRTAEANLVADVI